MPAIYNTKEKGYFHYMIYKEGNEYVAVCLDFNLVEYGLDYKELEKSIVEAARSYLNAVRKKKLPDGYLNLPAEKKYIEKLKEMEMRDELIKKSTKKKFGPSKKELSYFSNTKAPYYKNNMFV